MDIILKWLFLAIIIFSGINSIHRFDYNLPLFVCSLYVWTAQKENRLMFYGLVAYSLVVDIFWFLLWEPIWANLSSDARKSGLNYATGESFFHLIVSILSILNLLMKIAVFGLGFIIDDRHIKPFLSMAGIKNRVFTFLEL